MCDPSRGKTFITDCLSCTLVRARASQLRLTETANIARSAKPNSSSVKRSEYCSKAPAIRHFRSSRSRLAAGLVRPCCLSVSTSSVALRKREVFLATSRPTSHVWPWATRRAFVGRAVDFTRPERDNTKPPKRSRATRSRRDTHATTTATTRLGAFDIVLRAVYALATRPGGLGPSGSALLAFSRHRPVRQRAWSGNPWPAYSPRTRCADPEDDSCSNIL